MRRSFAVPILLLLAGTQAQACFTVVVGKDASADGFVIMAHNEDDGPPVAVNHYKAPRQAYPPGEMYTLLGGGQIAQPPESWAYIWSEMPGLLYSDSFLNEWGVCVTSDNCPSREDKPIFTDGGISWDLRRLVAQRAKSSREAVHIAAQLVERFGYEASGRTYIFSDPNEGWFFCAVQGKHWLAARVPDDQVAMVANTFSVHGVNLADTLNYLAAKDIVKYARSRGWYNPKADGEFDFANVYARADVSTDSSNFCRQWGGLRFVAATAVPLAKQLPFSVAPKQKVDIAAIMEVMRDHYDWTELYRVDLQNHSPHQTFINTICNWTTQTSFVAELRADLPPDIGLVYWVTLGPPCTAAYIPIYFGAPELPPGFGPQPEGNSPSVYFDKVQAPFQPDPSEAFWTYSNFHQKVYANYGDFGQEMKVILQAFQQRTMTLKEPIEEAALATFVTDKTAATLLLANYTNGLYLSWLEAMQKTLSRQ